MVLSSDVILTIPSVGSKEQKTRVIKKSLMPVWNESFEYLCNADSPPAELVLAIWGVRFSLPFALHLLPFYSCFCVFSDWDLVSKNDFMALGRVDLSKLKQSQDGQAYTNHPFNSFPQTEIVAPSLNCLQMVIIGIL